MISLHFVLSLSARRPGRYDDVMAIHLSGHLISLAVFQQLRVRWTRFFVFGFTADDR